MIHIPRLLGVFLGLAVATALAITGGLGASAHEAHGKPALLQTGTCDALGGAAFTLIGVGAEEDADGLPIAPATTVGPESAAVLSTSTSTVDVTVEQIVDGGHAIVVYASDEEMDNPIACGAVGGIQLGDDLVVGLDPVGDDGMSGVALLRTSGTQATVTIVLSESAVGDAHAEGEEHSHDEDEGTPEA